MRISSNRSSNVPSSILGARATFRQIRSVVAPLFRSAPALPARVGRGATAQADALQGNAYLVAPLALVAVDRAAYGRRQRSLFRLLFPVLFPGLFRRFLLWRFGRRHPRIARGLGVFRCRLPAALLRSGYRNADMRVPLLVLRISALESRIALAPARRRAGGIAVGETVP